MNRGQRITVGWRMSKELRAAVGVRLATIRAVTGEHVTFGRLVEELLTAWLEMPCDCKSSCEVGD